MISDYSHQRLYDSVSLVPRVGDRSDNELCVMSLVALLAGERHTDRPQAACPVIATFAIKVNDGIDCDTRQSLKPFAPRIVGTRDGLARGRAWVLVNGILGEVLPRWAHDFGHTISAELLGKLRVGSQSFDAQELHDLYAVVRQEAAHLGLDRGRVNDIRYLLRACERGSDELVANSCASILSDFARHPASPEDSSWYWNKAIELIDRICDVGDGPALAGAQIEHHANTQAQRIRAQETYGPVLQKLFGARKQRSKTDA
ncbi:MAG: hypothetical protein OER92_07205 [Alphaproteobacteria bacterium]|nr:hypothetical protein [Alphaproteobacteria bacterium]